MKKPIITGLLLIITCLFNIYAQDKEENTIPVHLQLSTMSYGDSIVLRWGYEQSSAWRTLNQYGFVLERLTLDKNNKVMADAFSRLTPEPVKPWPLDEWESKVSENENYALMAAQALYGKSFEMTSVSNQVQVMQDEADESQNRFAFAMFSADLSPLAAEGLGLRYVDRNIKKDKKYIYRLYSDHPTTFFTTDTILFVINASDVYKPMPPSGVQAVEGDRQVILSWPKADKYTAYYMEKSLDGGNTYQKVNEYPYIQISRDKQPIRKYTYTDSLKKNYEPYLYRIAGITAFGDLSPWSEPMKAMGRDRTPPPAPVIQEINNPSGNQVTIEWDIPQTPPDMKGFFVGKSANVAGPFKPLNKEALSPQTRTYQDESIDIHGKNYYVVVSVDTAKNVNNSMPAYVMVVDSVPPAKPTGLQGDIDKSGVVTLHWPAGTEPDLKGYRVYSSNSPTRNLIPLSRGTIMDTVFKDTITLNTLNENIYYSIIAVDMNYNNSPYADRLMLKKPDTLSPVAPVIRNYNIKNQKVTIEWVPSSSEDVTEHVVFRREGDKEWVEYKRYPENEKIFIDSNVTERGDYYHYAIQAIDDVGLKSPLSEPVKVRIYDKGIRGMVERIDAEYDSGNNEVEISWDYPQREKCRFLLYRSYNGEGLTMHAHLEGEKRKFTDNRINREGTYQYALKAVYSGGGKSTMSDKIEVEVYNSEE